MDNDSYKKHRLSHRFHQTFIPERHYLSALLTFAGEDGTGGDLDISEKTDIPTGKSSGKVPATIQYARGMGLISVSGKGKDRRLAPTLLGKAVLDGDPNLGKPLTQWLIHLNLCRRMGGAENWHLCFGPGADLLGNRFTRNELEDFLAGRLGRAKRSLIGPMVRAYEDPVSLKTAGVLRQEEGTIVRKPAPLSPEYGCGYGAFLLSLWDAHFPDDRQVTLTDLEKETFWGRVHGWNEAGREAALDAVRTAGAVTIDKQMRPWVLTRSAHADDLWPRIYK
jgi:hypothetical protein